MMMKIEQITGMNLHYLRYSLDYFLNSMEKLEIPNIELWGGFPHFYAEDVSLADAKELKRKLTARNLHLVCYTPEQLMYANNIASKSAAVRKRSLDYYEKNIELASELGTNYMLMTAGTGPFDEQVAPYWEIARESLARLSSKAEQAGVTLLLEALQNFESNIINRSDQLKIMLQEVNSPSLKGMLDLVGMHASGEGIQDYLQNIGEICHIHLIDGTPSGHIIPGEGQLPLKQYIRQINDFGYEGYYGLELCSSKYFPDPHHAVAASLEYVKKHLV
jgi:fructoselysine 3-epimerase